MASQKRRAKRGAKTTAGARDPLQSLADRYRLTLDELKERVRTSASAQVALAKWRGSVLRFQAAVEECMRTYAAIDGNEKGALLIGQLLGVKESEPLPGRSRKRPWLLAAIASCEGSYGPLYSGDDEDREAVERRILLEFGASPNEIAASRNPTPNHPVRNYASSAVARKARRDIERLCRDLSTEISELKGKRQALDGDPPDGFKLGHMVFVSYLDERIADREDILARLSARRRRRRS